MSVNKIAFISDDPDTTLLDGLKQKLAKGKITIESYPDLPNLRGFIGIIIVENGRTHLAQANRAAKTGVPTIYIYERDKQNIHGAVEIQAPASPAHIVRHIRDLHKKRTRWA